MRRPNHCIGGEIRATYRIPIRLDYAAVGDLIARGCGYAMVSPMSGMLIITESPTQGHGSQLHHEGENR